MNKAMFTKELGKTGVQIPEVGLGTWHYHAGPEPLRQGLDAGACFIDTAESYDTEEVVRQAMGQHRDEVFLASKVSPSNFRRADLLKAAEGSLRRLGTDRIDLYQLHKPNDAIPLEETLGAMEELVDAGKVRFIGVSNFSQSELQRAQRAMRMHPIVSNQMRYNLGHVFKPMEPFNWLLVIDKRYGSFPGSDEFKRAAVEAAKKIDLIAGDTSAPGCACANPAEAVRPRMTS